MALVDARGFQLVSDVQGAVGQGLQAAGQMQQLQGVSQARDLTQQTQQLTGVILDPMSSPADKVAAQQQLTAINPQATQNLQTIEAGAGTQLDADQSRRLKSAALVGVEVANTPSVEGKISLLEAKMTENETQGLDSNETLEALNLYRAGKIDQADALYNKAVKVGQAAGLIEVAGGRGSGAGIKSFAPITIINPETKEKRLVSPTVDPISGNAVLEPFDLPEGFEVSTETTEEKRAADVLAKAKIEENKLSAQFKMKPQIEAAVTEARAKAANRGEAFTELSQARAALPGLTSAVDNLRELSSIATSTFGGKVFDVAVKESGFGSTKGATARAKFIAIINNQVLPLLKPTFGAAFTVQEGEALKATMGDPDASPQAKMAQLDAFIAQKLRDIETKQAVLQQPEGGQAQPAAQQQVLRFDAQGNMIQ